MAGILIIAHAPFATALRDCLAHVYCGLPPNIGAIDVLPDCEPSRLAAEAQAEVERLRELNGVLVLSDVVGATPCNIAARLAGLPDVRVLAGVSLPMLLRAVCYRTTPLEQLAEKAVAGGVNGVQAVQSAAPAASSPFSCPAEHYAATDCHHHQ